MDLTPIPTDEEAAKAIQLGDPASFGLIMERYESRMLRYGRKFLKDSREIEDIVQEVFIKAYKNIQSFDVGKRFSPWIYRIAHNEFINSIRKQERAPLLYFDPDVIFPHPVSSESPVKDMERDDTKRIMDKVMNILPVKYREPLILFYYEDLSYEEISDVMQMPVSTVGVRIKRGKEALKRIIDKSNNIKV